MKYRCVGKFTIAVGKSSYKEIIDSMNDITDELNKLGVKCKLYLKKRLIVTNNIIIRFILKKQYKRYNRNVYNVRANGCYGFDDIEIYNITNGKNQCKGYELIDYILERNKNNGKRENIS